MKRRNFLCLILLPHVAWAHSYRLGAIQLGHAWGLPTGGPETSVMMPILNTGAEPDVLIAATSPMAQSIEFRDAAMRVDEFLLEPKRRFPMRASAKHLQVIGLAKPMAKDEKLPLTLTFKIAGQISIDVQITDKAGE